MNPQRLIKSYKNNTASQYKFYELEMLEQIPDQEYFCSKKLDGQTFFLVIENKDTKIFSSSYVDYSEQLSHIIQVVQSKTIKENIIMVGELYDSSKERERNGDVKVGLSNKKIAPLLSLALFDIVYQESPQFKKKELFDIAYEELSPSQFKKNYEKLSDIFGNNQSDVIYTLEQQLLSKNKIKEFAQKIFKENKEGVIIRNDSNIIKIKKEETLDALILGFSLEADQKTLRSLSFGILKNSNQILYIGSSGNIDTSINKKELMGVLQKNIIPCDYIQTASNGAAYQFVKPTVVVRVKFFDFQIEKSDENSIKKPLFLYENNALQCVGKNQSLSLIASVIEEIRSDKQATVEQCGLSQITRLSGLTEEYFNINLDLNGLAKSEIQQLKTFVKESKKGRAIRKFMLWKTNKQETGVYPNYIFYYLDYSEGRKDTMKRDLKPFHEETIAMKFFNTSIEENVKKGWEEHIYG